MKTYLCILAAVLFPLRELPAQTSTQPLINSGDTWKYFATGQAPASTAWTGSGSFDDATWQQGASQLGYGGDGERTVVSYGPNTQNKFITTYFRRTVAVSNVSGTFTLTYKRDDGIIIYVNGTELKREYLPTGVISYTTLASTVPEAEEPLWKTVDLPASLLRVGNNVIAAEVHQASPTSSDMRFDLELKATRQVAALPPSISLERGPYLQRYSDDPNLVIPADKRSMTIRWSTSAAADGRVIYKTPTGSPVVSPWQSSTALSFEAGTPEPKTIYNVSVTLTNLEPDTPYSYTIQSESLLQGDATNYFRTAPITGSTKKVRIWALGDFGKKPESKDKPDAEQIKVRNGFNSYVQANVPDQYIDLWLWLGDNAYDWGRDWEFQRSVFDVYDGRKNSAPPLMRQTPIFATPGNHDYRNNQDAGALARTNHSLNHYFEVVNHMTAGDAVGEHSKKEEYYSFDHANIHFVSLDSYGYQKNTATGVQETTVFPAGGVQLEWLKRDLERAQASPKIKWIVVFFHHPPYTITLNSHNSDTESDMILVRERLLKSVLENYKVDLVLSGHSHNYQRSWPIQGHYGLEQEFTASMDAFRVPVAATLSGDGRFDCVTATPTSSTLTSLGRSMIYHKSTTATKNHTVYIVNGSGGGTEGIAGPQWPHDAMQGFAWEGGSMYLEIEGNRLEGKFINAEGVVRDQFKIIKDADTFTIPVTDGTTRKPDCECDDAAGYTHYVERTPAGNANLLLSIKKNGINIGKVGDGTFDLQLKGKPGGTTVLYNYPDNYVRTFYHDKDEGDWTVMNRHWTLKPTVALPGNSQFTVRHYYTDADMYAARPFWISHTNMKFLKYNDFGSFEAQTADPTDDGQAYAKIARNYKSSGVWVYDNGPTPSPSGWAYKSLGNGNHYGEFVTGRLMNGAALAPSARAEIRRA